MLKQEMNVSIQLLITYIATFISHDYSYNSNTASYSYVPYTAKHLRGKLSWLE